MSDPSPSVDALLAAAAAEVPPIEQTAAWRVLVDRGAILVNPDCAAGKHRACRGDAWDFEKDEPADCGCPCHRDTPGAHDVLRDGPGPH